MSKKPYRIVLDEIARHMARAFPADFEAVLRAKLPTLEDAARIEPLEREPWRFQVELRVGEEDWVAVIILEQDRGRLDVLGVYPKWTPLAPVTREEAIAEVEAGIGKGKRGPTGVEYVESIRHIWKGLLPRDERDS